MVKTLGEGRGLRTLEFRLLACALAANLEQMKHALLNAADWEVAGAPKRPRTTGPWSNKHERDKMETTPHLNLGAAKERLLSVAACWGSLPCWYWGLSSSIRPERHGGMLIIADPLKKAMSGSVEGGSDLTACKKPPSSTR